ncbi:unnamed protein product [Lymnaea stagnalis]|uniref:Uncharacterized protein n=1 Tax=Lymnaea stagnalis TaxID=6523 RepID=A0AAV2I585_LYMST
MMAQRNTEGLIRKFRKKLRQIENLERLNRYLTEEEIIKVDSKSDIRACLHKALKKLQQEQEAILEDEDDRNSRISDVGYSTEYQSPVSSKVTLGGDETVDSEGTKTSGDAVKKTKKSPAFSMSNCSFTLLEGHSDLITSVLILDDKILTSSRDTTVKCWSINDLKETHSFGGHTETVTCLLTLGPTFDAHFAANDYLIVSGSLDCTVKFWSLNTGQQLKSIYTYNAITKVGFFPRSNCLITGSDGGKLELWRLVSGEEIFSCCPYEDSVTGLVVQDDVVYSCSADGLIQVHMIQDGILLTCVFVSEFLKTEAGRPVNFRHVRCLEVGANSILYGDDSSNIKVLDWKRGAVTKLANHVSYFSSTDAIRCHGDFILASGYDLDEGLGFVNVRSSQTLNYLATIDDNNTERIICLDFSVLSENSMLVVTGGMELKAWRLFSADKISKSNQEDVYPLEYRRGLSEKAEDSDVDSTDEADDDSDDDSCDDSYYDSDDAQTGWNSWCNIV